MEKKRLLSLDVLRGITVAGMILVNNAGGSSSYAPLKHSVWNGLTPCDLVFPFFLFIMGISTYLSLGKFEFKASPEVLLKIARRTILILLIGWSIDWFYYICQGDFFPISHIRVTGVLFRIALCYGITSVLVLYFNPKSILRLAVFLLMIYVVILFAGNGYCFDESNLLSVIDRKLLGVPHLYRKSVIDPEGLMSTLPAIAHTLIGFYCGKIIVGTKDLGEKMLRLFFIGFVLIGMGWLFSDAMPFNKRIWSPTFVCVTCGAASSLLALLIYFIDFRRKQKWGRFFVIFGVNPLFLYVLSELLAIGLEALKIKEQVYAFIQYLIVDSYLASAIYALLFVAFLGGSGYLLYRNKIYIKV